MYRVLKCVTILISLLAIISCGGAASSQSGENCGEVIDMVKYARGFVVKQADGVKLIEISDPVQMNKTVYKYALVPRGNKSAKVPKGYSKVEIPVKGVICMTTLQLSSFIKMDLTDRIVGITSTRFLKNEKLNRRLQSGELSKIGIEGEFDTEVVLSLSPDVIFVSPFKRGGYDAVENLGIPTMAYLAYKESSPLGQAEWIKLTGLLTGREAEAEEHFSKIEKRYNELCDMVDDIEHRPKVLSGEMHSGNWYVVGGKSYLAELFRDAGADYFMQNDDESGGFYVDYETVYSQGHDADFWRIVNNFDGEYGYDDLLKSDGRYKDFASFQKRQVLYCNLHEMPFYENTPMEPDVVLADLIKVFHPTLLPSHEAVYYKLLK